MYSVQQRIKLGQIPDLTRDSLARELRSLDEDLENWDHGHVLVVHEQVLHPAKDR